MADTTRRNFLMQASTLAAASLLPIGARAAQAGDATEATDTANAPRGVIIDCDPGQDDTIAILFALGATDRLDVRALTAVAGNVPLELTSRNARIIRDWAGRTATLPVYAGCPRPIARELVTAANVHGKTGIEGVTLPEPQAPLAPQHAVQFLIDTLRAAPKRSLTLCALGPLTNLATALTEAPEIRDGIREIVMMGGAFFERGNITPAAEFNVYVDPEAAKIVFASGVPIVVLPRDVAVKAAITPARVAPLRAIGKRCSTIVADIMAAELAYQKQRRGVESAPMYDPTATGYLIAPQLFRGRLVNVEVETTGQWTLGETVVDWSGHSGRPPNATWITEVEADGFYAALRERIAALP